MLVRKLCSVFAAVSVSGTVLASPFILAPSSHASEAVVKQTSPGAPNPTEDFHPMSYYLLAGDTDTFDPVAFRTELPTGTTLELEEGAAVDALRAEGWTISVTNSFLTVTAPRSAEGDYQIPVVFTLPDDSTQVSFVTMNVDYLVDIPLSILIPANLYLSLAQSSTSSTMA